MPQANDAHYWKRLQTGIESIANFHEIKPSLVRAGYLDYRVAPFVWVPEQNECPTR